MKDETYVFISDVKNKGSVARSARHRKTHTGKGGRARLPSDYLTKKELEKMSGECKSYRLNEPMAWKEFRTMPDDIKVTYIKLIRQKYDVPDCELCKMFGKDKDTISWYFKKLNLRVPRKNVHRNWKKEEWFAWVNGVEKLPTPVPEEKLVTEEMPDRLYSLEEAEAFIEEDIHLEEPDRVPVEKYIMLDAEICALKHRTNELLKVNEELIAAHEKDKQKIEWLENRVNDLELERHILEKQMDVVRMIFGGANR